MAQEKNEKDFTENNLEVVENALSKTEQFVENNKKILTFVITAIVVIVGGYLGYNKFYMQPRQEEAAKQMFQAEFYFEKDSFKLALNGAGRGTMGFLQIIDEYGSTTSGNLAKYYAGICYLHTKQYAKAVEMLEQFKTNDKLLAPVTTGAIGDSKMELGQTKEAIELYLKAAEKSKNEFTTPIYLMKAGMAYEKTKDYANALKIYEQLEKEYGKTQEGRKAEKYIAKMKLLLNQL